MANAQLLQTNTVFTHADTLRGSVTKYRQGWNVTRYNLSVEVDIEQQSIRGNNIITYYESEPVRTMQIDLQQPMVIDSIINDGGGKVEFVQEGNAWMAKLKPEGAMIKFLPAIRSLRVYYHGKPIVAKRAPWDGGLVWKKDANNNPWIATACQGAGASIWWPCKDYQGDEPDSGMVISITVPDTLMAISNGRLLSSVAAVGDKHKRTFTWAIQNPINTYNVTMNIGKYTSWNEVYTGEGGKLDLQYWALSLDYEKAKKQFEQVKPMLQCFEHWFGKYPFYEDGYKLVQTPFLGMEHQSAVAYGNRFLNGYLGRDRSKSGYGLLWDYIIIHESGHEWFGNNITTEDIADMWVHEGFTTYSEVLYTECQSGKKAGYEYMTGLMKDIQNDKNIIGAYGVNEEGSGDMYNKGAAMIHNIRNLVNDDEKFRHLLRDMQQTFYHGIVSSATIESFIINKTGLPLQPVFNQYLRTTTIPVLEYSLNKKRNRIKYRITNAVEDFMLPLIISAPTGDKKLKAATRWKKTRLSKQQLTALTANVQNRYLLTVKEITPKQ
jgi:aminopeptidase N